MWIDSIFIWHSTKNIILYEYKAPVESHNDK